MMSIGSRIKQRRTELNMSQEVFITNAYLYPNTTKVAVVYNNEPLVMYNIEDIDLSLK